MKQVRRCSAIAAILVVAVLVAAGCGGGGGSSDASSAAKSADALDLIPQDAFAYATINADFMGSGWDQFDKLAPAFDASFKGVGEQVSEMSKDGENPVDFEKDIDPWLGDSAGVAILSVNDSKSTDKTPAAESSTEGDSSGAGAEDAKVMAWFDLDDRAAFEKYIEEEEKFTKGKDAGDFATWEKDDSFFGVSDDFAIATQSRADLEERATYDGDSILDADGIGDVIDEADGDSLATLILSGDGVRKLVKDTPELSTIKDAPELKSFKGMSMSFKAEDDGMRLHGYVASDGKQTMKNTENAVFSDLPENTLLAIGGSDFGGSLETALNDAGKSNQQVQQAVGAASGALGVDVADLAKAFDGGFAMAAVGDDEGLGSLVGGVAGAVMGGGLDGIDPSQLASAASIVLAFEETGDSSKTLDKIVGAVGGLTGAAGGGEAGTAGDFETKTLNLGGLSLTTAASKDIAALSVGADVFSTWGDKSLADNASFSAAWDASGAPDDRAASLWFDFSRVAKLAGIKSGEGVTPGGWVGWAEADGSSASLDMFMHVDVS